MTDEDAPTADPGLRRGALVGRYVLRRLLVETPQHRIFQGRGLAGGRRVQVKVMDERHRRRRVEAGEVANPYVRELRLAVDAHSECLVRHVDVGTTPEGEHYLVREDVEGAWVRDELEAAGRLEMPEAVAIVADAAAAAESVHRLGYVLRDLGPDGLLTRRRHSGSALRDTLVVDLEASCRAGTPGPIPAGGGRRRDHRYLAPELVLGGAAEPASDVYALGALLLELLAGHPAVDGAGDPEASPGASEGDGTPPSTSIRGGLSELGMDVELLLDKCMDREPSRRPGVAELLRGMGHVLRGWADVHGDHRVPKDLWPRLVR